MTTPATKSRSRGLTKGFLALVIIAGILSVTPSAAWASHNVNFEGTWTMSSHRGGYGTLVITNENATTGTFTGTIEYHGLDINNQVFSGQLNIISGHVTGDQFSLTAEPPGNTMGFKQIDFEYIGTITGNSMTYQLTGVTGVLTNGNTVSIVGRGRGTGTREANIVVSTVSPAVGPEEGGTNISLTGQGFDGATAVDFVLASGVSVPAKSFNVDSSTTISVVTPSVANQVSSTVNQTISDVIVSVDAAKSNVSTGDKFTFMKLSVTSLSAKTGLAQGGSKFTVTGTGFIDVTGVEFAPSSSSFNSPVQALQYNVISPTSISVTTPSATSLIAAGSSKVVTDLVVKAGTKSSPTVTGDQYTFELLQLTKVSPANGPLRGGTQITLKGQGFKQVTDVVFVYDATRPGVPAPFRALSDKIITLTSPDMSSYVGSKSSSLLTDIIVTVGNFPTKAHSTDHFEFANLAVTSLSPMSGSVTGGTLVTLKGSGLSGVTTVTLTDGSSRVSATAIKPTNSSLTFVAPSITKLTGLKKLAFNVTVAVGATSSAPSKNAVFTYLPPVG